MSLLQELESLRRSGKVSGWELYVSDSEAFCTFFGPKKFDGLFVIVLGQGASESDIEDEVRKAIKEIKSKSFHLPKPLPSSPVKLRGDWAYWQGNHFLRYTWKHRIRLAIGLDGHLGGQQYCFRRVHYRSRTHRLLNWLLNKLPPKANRKRKATNDPQI